MSLVSRRGFSLAELLVALALLGVVTAILFRLLAANLRLYRSQTQVLDRGQNLRAAALLLAAELRELSASDGDIYAAAPTSMSFRAMRRLGFVCEEWQPGDTHLTVRREPQFGSRDFDASSDSLLIYVSDDATDHWLVAPLFATRAGTCADGTPAVVLEASGVAGPFSVGTPVRAFESVTYRLYRASDGEWQIGQAAGGDVIQPLVGPVTAAGLELDYRDAAGARVTDLQQVAAIEIRLRLLTAEPVRGSNGLARSVDSIVMVVALRNNRLK